MPSASKLQTFSISYNPHCISSLRQALAQYRQYIVDDSIFSNCESPITYQLDVDSDDSLGNTLSSEFGNVVFAYHINDPSSLTPETLLSDTHLNAETCLFFRACFFKELESDLFETAKVICAVSRKVNDSGDTWVSETEVFGLMPLFMIGYCYPQYAYLLGGSVIPYWDDEHAPYGLDMLAILTHYLDYNEHTLKAFCFCDNNTARARMFSLSIASTPDYGNIDLSSNRRPLLHTLREQPEEFSRFKTLLKKRFSEQDYLQTYRDSDYYNENPIEEIILSILLPDKGEAWFDDKDERENPLLEMFIDSRVEDVVADLKAEIEEYLGRPIVPPKPDDEEDEHTTHYFHGTAIQAWKAFTQESFDEGEAIWQYIFSGEGKEVLTRIEACDVPALAKAGNHNISKTMEYYLGQWDSFNDELEIILRDLLSDWTDEDTDEETLSQNGQKILRMLDVIHRWNGKTGFNTELMQAIVSDYELIGELAFINRYGGDGLSVLNGCINAFSHYRDTVSFDDFKPCYALITAIRAGTLNTPSCTNALEAVQAIEVSGDHPEATMAALYAGILEWDSREQESDALTHYAVSYLEEHLPRSLYKALVSCSSFHHNKHYPDFSSVDSEQAEKWAPIESWLQGDHDEAEIVIAHIEPFLERCDHSEQLSSTQPYYQFLRDFDDCAQKLLVCAHVVATRPGSRIQGYCQRFVELWLRLAPCKTARMLGYFFMDSKVEPTEALMNLLPSLNGISDIGAMAFTLETLIERERNDDLAETLSPFIAMLGGSETNEGDNSDIAQALKLILPRREQIFYKTAEAGQPKLAQAYFDQTLQALAVGVSQPNACSHA